MENKNNNNAPKGTNENDVEIVKLKQEAAATNQHDVEIAKVNFDIEQIRKDAAVELEKYKADKEQEIKKLQVITDAAKGLGYAGMALAGYIISVNANKEVRQHAIEFGKE